MITYETDYLNVRGCQQLFNHGHCSRWPPSLWWGLSFLSQVSLMKIERCQNQHRSQQLSISCINEEDAIWLDSNDWSQTVTQREWTFFIWYLLLPNLHLSIKSLRETRWRFGRCSPDVWQRQTDGRGHDLILCWLEADPILLSIVRHSRIDQVSGLLWN